MSIVRRMLTRCTEVAGDPGDTYRGTLHIHTWPWGDSVRELIFVPPTGQPFAVDQETMREAVKQESWAAAVEVFHLNR